MADYSFSLPWPPSVNVWKTPFKNRMILSKRGRDYRVSVAESMRLLGLDGEMLTGRLTVSLKLYPPTLRRFDVDNFTKSLFDALTSCGFWEDDEQVYRLTVEKMQKEPPGRVDIKVTSY